MGILTAGLLGFGHLEYNIPPKATQFRTYGVCNSTVLSQVCCASVWVFNRRLLETCKEIFCCFNGSVPEHIHFSPLACEPYAWPSGVCCDIAHSLVWEESQSWPVSVRKRESGDLLHICRYLSWRIKKGHSYSLIWFLYLTCRLCASLMLIKYHKSCVTLISNTLGYIEMENKLTSSAWMKTITLIYSKSRVWETLRPSNR